MYSVKIQKEILREFNTESPLYATQSLSYSPTCNRPRKVKYVKFTFYNQESLFLSINKQHFLTSVFKRYSGEVNTLKARFSGVFGILKNFT